MCEALRELMKDEIERDVNAAMAKGEANIIRKMHNNGVSPAQISASTGMKLEDVNAILAGKELINAKN